MILQQYVKFEILCHKSIFDCNRSYPIRDYQGILNQQMIEIISILPITLNQQFNQPIESTILKA